MDMGPSCSFNCDCKGTRVAIFGLKIIYLLFILPNVLFLQSSQLVTVDISAATIFDLWPSLSLKILSKKCPTNAFMLVGQD